jgi:hypothetical protein
MDNTLHELVQLTIKLCLQHQDAEDGYICELLDQSGVDEALSDDLVSFVPMGFCRALFDGTGVSFPPNYTIRNPITREQASFPLADQPVFQEAYRAAEDWAANDLDEDLSLVIAARSAEFKVIQWALEAGAKLNMVITGETLFSDKNWHPITAKQPWWRFWRKR